MTQLIHPRLESDSTFITDFALCQVRLSNNAAFPWLLLIPKRYEVSEIFELSTAEQHLLMSEIVLASQVMHHLFQPTKLNVANLGNIVSQLHVHIVARYNNDEAWPDPVWSSGICASYDPEKKEELINKFQDAFLRLCS